MSDRSSDLQVTTNVAAFALNTARERTVEAQSLVEARAEREREDEQVEKKETRDADTQVSLSTAAESTLPQGVVQASGSATGTAEKPSHAVDIVV